MCLTDERFLVSKMQQSGSPFHWLWSVALWIGLKGDLPSFWMCEYPPQLCLETPSIALRNVDATYSSNSNHLMPLICNILLLLCGLKPRPFFFFNLVTK